MLPIQLGISMEENILILVIILFIAIKIFSINPESFTVKDLVNSLF